jgi:hypothetical protein
LSDAGADSRGDRNNRRKSMQPLSLSMPGWRAAPAVAAAAVLSGCLSMPQKSDAPASAGAAGGAAAVGADAKLNACAETVGSVRLQDGNAAPDTRGSSGERGDSALESVRLLLRDVNSMQQQRESRGAGGGVTIDSLRLLIQQSNCLAIVERGLGESAATDEKRRARASGNEMRDDANMGQGQEVAADFVLRSMVLSATSGENSSGVRAGGLLPSLLGGISAGKSDVQAEVQLVLFDVRTKVQLAVAHGHGSATDVNLATSVLGRAGAVFGGGQVSTGSKTPLSKVILQAYADAYNKLVPALVNYKTQMVKGGLGAGGTLKVQGSATAGQK